jgi:prepilin-type N-terminal cleavage/methylation domain-containing protein
MIQKEETMKRNGFSLMELLTVVVVLGIVMAVAMPIVSQITNFTTKSAFEKDVRMIMKAIDYKLLVDESFDPTSLDKEGIELILGLSVDNYTTVHVSDQGGELFLLIEGEGKWANFVACGTLLNITVSDEGECNGEFSFIAVTFSPNGNANYLQSNSTVVTVNGAVVGSTKYLWTTSEEEPSEASFINSFNSGDIIATPAGVTANYYLWILGKNEEDQTAIRKSNVFRLDNTPPAITLLGDNPVTITLGQPYVDAHATASDIPMGDITGSIVTTHNVNTFEAGSYYVRYNVSDQAGNTATQVERTVNVVEGDVVGPVILFVPSGNTTYAQNRSTTVTASDPSGVDESSLKYQWTTSTEPPSEVSFSTSFTNGSVINSPAGATGGYYLWILAKDLINNTSITRSNVFNLDNIAPIITMTGISPTLISIGEPYSDAGATADDNIDGDITGSIVTTNNLNINIAGSYYVRYNVSDTAGNAATQVERTVIVGDNSGPGLTFDPNGNTTYARNRSTTVTASDPSGVDAGSLKYQWTTSMTAPSEVSFTLSFTNGSVINSPVGVTGGYYLWVLAKDTLGNTTIGRSAVFNLDNTPPVITITGDNPITVNLGSVYNDAGATYSDAHSGIASSNTPVSTVNTSVTGTYTVTYGATDNAGNTNSAVRTVHVTSTDSDGPTIAFVPNGSITYARNRSTTVTASDPSGVDTGSLKYQWTTSLTAPTEGSFSTSFANGSVINSPAGVTGGYYLWVLAKDLINNTSITRSNVFNLDNIAPVITMTGISPVTVSIGGPYNDAGATADDNIDGDITGNIVTTNNVNVNVIGSYYVRYNVSDTAGNTATQVERTVNVVDNTGPTLVFNPNGNTIYAQNRSSTVTASDPSGVDTGSLKYQWTTSLTAPTEVSFTLSFTNGSAINSPAGVNGGYYLWILAKDTIGNTTIGRSNIFNLDNTAPVIIMLGNSPVTVPLGGPYSDAGATASDNIDGNITGNIVPTSTVNVNSEGTYTVTYNVSDQAGNAATPVVRTVNVVDMVLTYDFNFTGNFHTWLVPSTGRYKLEVWGAAGGGAAAADRANGGYAYGEMNLTAGQTLYIYVGGSGGIYQTGGWNGGQDGGASTNAPDHGYKGGGASDIRIGGQTLGHRVIVAGGGGGATGDGTAAYRRSGGGGGGGGYYGGGGGGGGWLASATFGEGGTQSAGGAGGLTSDGAKSTTGVLGIGGFGGSTTSTATQNAVGVYPGGVGGGTTGLNGVAAATRSGSGGGGSSYIGGTINDGTNGTEEGIRTGNGFVRISVL